MKHNLIFSISFFLSFINFLIYYSYPFKLAELKRETGMAGIIVGIATIFTLVMRIVSGVIIDKFRLKWAMSISAVLYITMLLLINSNGEIAVIIGRLLLGLLLGIMSTLLMYHILTESRSNAEKARNVSMITFFNILPTCLAPFVALKMNQIWGNDSVVLFTIILFFICLLLIFVLDMQTVSIGGTDSIQAELFSDGLRRVSMDKNVRTSIIAVTLIYIVSGTTITFLPTYLLKSAIKDPSWYFLIFSLSMMLPRLMLRNYLPHSTIFPVQLLLFCATLGLIGNLINYFLTENLLIFISAICNGVALGLVYPAVISYVVCCLGKNLSGTLSSVVAAAADLGVVCANLGLGIINVSFDENTTMMMPISCR